jgi:hypothetical protein
MFRSKLTFRRKPRESDFERELQFHIEQATSEFIAQGMTPDEARRSAFVEFGGKEQAVQGLRDGALVALARALRRQSEIRTAPDTPLARFFRGCGADAGSRHWRQYRRLLCH